MGERTGIEWTDHTWNPWRGCAKVSPGCKHCYMFRDQRRYGMDPATVVRAARQTFRAPLRWREPAMVFTCSWSDWFIEGADEWRADAWAIVRETPWLRYQILTKRPELVADRLPADWGEGWPNVWLGVSVEDQAHVHRWAALQEIPAAVRFLSCEPLLGPLELGDLAGLDWLIAGGESGPGCRPMDPAWAERLRDRCVEAGVPFFFKQHGGTRKIDGAWGGDRLAGERWQQFPEVIAEDDAGEVTP